MERKGKKFSCYGCYQKYAIMVERPAFIGT